MTFQLDAFPWAAGEDSDFAYEGLGLEGFRVWSYRSVRDSGYVPLSAMTALVGREQSGKTTLLRALWGLDPRLLAPYSVQLDWPRGLKPRVSREQVVCAAKLRFQPSLRDDLINRGMIDPWAVGIHLGRTFANAFCVSVLDQVAFDAPLRGHSLEWAKATPSVESEILGGMPTLIYSSADWALPEKFPSADIEEWLRPTGPAPKMGPQEASPAEWVGLRALASFAQHRVGDSVPTWLARINEKLASFRLSEALRLTDDRGLIRVLARSGATWRPLGLLPLARRYLVTLDLRIAAAREAGGPAPVLLLDAPGRAFKGGLKRQLRGSLERYTAAGIQVAYTARLPFHVELQHPEQVLVLARDETAHDPLCDGPLGTGKLMLHAALGMQGRSSFRIDDVNLVVEGPTDASILLALSKLFAASGESALPEDLNVVSAGGAFEVASVAAFLARQGLGAVALFDSDAAGVAGQRQLEAYSRDERFLRPVTGLLIGEAALLKAEEATIEDLFPPTEYLAALRSVAGEHEKRVLTEIEGRMDLKHRLHLARQLRKAYESRGWRFPKMAVAQALAEKVRSCASIEDLDPNFRASIQALLVRLHAAIEAHQRPAAKGPRR